MQIITHDGNFHADELLALALLRDLHPQAVVRRTRDGGVIASATPPDIVVDVGGVFDPSRNRYDHHQEHPPRRDDGTPFSAFGLVWRAFGMDWLATRGVEPELVPRLFEEIDRSFVRIIDLVDNGILDPTEMGPARDLTLPRMVFDLNAPAPGGVEDDGRRFERAAGFCAVALQAHVARLHAEISAEAAVRMAIEQSSGPILELSDNLPFDDAIRAAGERAAELKLVVHPRRLGWCVSGIRKEPPAHALRLDLPESWAGLMDAELAAVTGIPDARFCHRNRFMAVADSRDGALALAELALDAEPEAIPHP